ncbi:unnamed protein product [Leuciscus chuanchicus]
MLLILDESMTTSSDPPRLPRHRFKRLVRGLYYKCTASHGSVDDLGENASSLAEETFADLNLHLGVNDACSQWPEPLPLCVSLYLSTRIEISSLRKLSVLSRFQTIH